MFSENELWTKTSPMTSRLKIVNFLIIPFRVVSMGCSSVPQGAWMGGSEIVLLLVLLLVLISRFGRSKSKSKSTKPHKAYGCPGEKSYSYSYSFRNLRESRTAPPQMRLSVFEASNDGIINFCFSC